MKKLMKSAWGIGIGTTLLGFTLTVLYDLVKDKSILSTIWNIIKAIWRLIITALNLELRLWWILLGIVVLILILLVIAKISDLKNAEISNVSFLNYKNDKIQGWYWSWHWERQYDGKYHIIDLYPLCPKCKTPMRTDSYDYLKCPRCRYNSIEYMPNIGDIEMVIINNIDRGLFPKEGEKQ
ncbi:MAG: hypothetical protein Q4D26_08805 [Clostridia bacterium]|nr:hypothetical protein [Clostridia bacterium]